jgi:hypothetical protein
MLSPSGTLRVSYLLSAFIIIAARVDERPTDQVRKPE